MEVFIITPFPDSINVLIENNIANQGIKKRLLNIETVNLRDFTSDNYKKTIKKIKFNIKENGIGRTFFSGLVMRAISTGYYTTFLLFVPYIINNNLYKKNI